MKSRYGSMAIFNVSLGVDHITGDSEDGRGAMGVPMVTGQTV